MGIYKKKILREKVRKHAYDKEKCKFQEKKRKNVHAKDQKINENHKKVDWKGGENILPGGSFG